MQYLHSISYLLLSLLVACSFPKKTPVESELGINEAIHRDKPIVLLISIDGYRHDYNELYAPPFLTKFEAEGSTTEGLTPVYPTNTFPNHYSQVTGLYPDNHGIIANSFYDPELERSYSLRDPSAVTDGTFYGGVPLWSLARQQGMVSATYFWPGSEAKIAGVRPHYYRQYNHGTPHEERVRTVLDWLKLPPENRPHFITLYFSDVDSAGHAHGPESTQVAQAIEKVDKTLQSFLKEVDSLNLPVVTIIVSDHGMAALSFQRVEYFDNTHTSPQEKASYEHFTTHGRGPFIFHYYKGPENERALHIRRILAAHERGKHFKTYQRGNLPKHLNFNKNIRMGDLVTIAEPGFTIGSRRNLSVIAGGHGFDPTQSRDMDGIFWVQGPGIKKGLKLEAFENIHLYPFIAQILDLKIKEPIDARAEVLAPLLESQSR